MCENAPWRDEPTLQRLYHEQGLSSREIASQLGVSKTTILRWLDEHDIPTRKSTRDVKPRFRLSDHGYEMLRTQIDGETEVVYHHRLLAALEFGVSAIAGMHVHHKNGITWDNRPKNLELKANSEHVSHHHQEGHYEHRERDDTGRYLEREAWTGGDS